MSLQERARKALRDMGIEPSGDFDARTVREVVAGISKHQGFKLWRSISRFVPEEFSTKNP
tara:strand:- start:5 stop:184 length:180 start_codon:yes stop_codon:yes gene_type:complete